MLQWTMAAYSDAYSFTVVFYGKYQIILFCEIQSVSLQVSNLCSFGTFKNVRIGQWRGTFGRLAASETRGPRFEINLSNL